jgi:hypothetical protein
MRFPAHGKEENSEHLVGFPKSSTLSSALQEKNIPETSNSHRIFTGAVINCEAIAPPNVTLLNIYEDSRTRKWSWHI